MDSLQIHFGSKYLMMTAADLRVNGHANGEVLFEEDN